MGGGEEIFRSIGSRARENGIRKQKRLRRGGASQSGGDTGKVSRGGGQLLSKNNDLHIWKCHNETYCFAC